MTAGEILICIGLGLLILIFIIKSIPERTYTHEEWDEQLKKDYNPEAWKEYQESNNKNKANGKSK